MNEIEEKLLQSIREYREKKDRYTANEKWGQREILIMLLYKAMGD